MSFNLGRIVDCENRLQRDFIEFARLWSDVKDDWADTRRDKFEHEHLSTLGPSLNRFAAAMHEFSDAIRLADRELSDDRPLD